MIELTWYQFAAGVLVLVAIVLEGVWRQTERPEWWHWVRFPVAIGLGVLVGASLRKPKTAELSPPTTQNPALDSVPDTSTARRIDDAVDEAAAAALASVPENERAEVAELADWVESNR